jgi:hypothetical protein
MAAERTCENWQKSANLAALYFSIQAMVELVVIIITQGKCNESVSIRETHYNQICRIRFAVIAWRFGAGGANPVLPTGRGVLFRLRRNGFCRFASGIRRGFGHARLPEAAVALVKRRISPVVQTFFALQQA